ncbi:pilus assembly protein [uncultured Roseibium sp.]|uniref:pilus assembly protein n=1 Tax=uncultured Roseibium sp. TaxID=1936171 RepID=UPI0026386245|nr:pilus assembly protein [uncultured Roseibium sp.]
MFTRRTDRLVVLAAFLLLGGCADYMSHRDTVTVGAGNAMDANMGIHTIQPFPRQAYNTNLPGDGKKAVQAQERYLAPGDPDVVTAAGSEAAISGGS